MQWWIRYQEQRARNKIIKRMLTSMRKNPHEWRERTNHQFTKYYQNDKHNFEVIVNKKSFEIWLRNEEVRSIVCITSSESIWLKNKIEILMKGKRKLAEMEYLLDKMKL